MQFRGVRRRHRALNLTPLIDVVFLLLVFFMLTAHFVRNEALNIDLPRAQTSTAIKKSDVLEIVLDGHGHVLIDGLAVSPADLDEAVAKGLEGHMHKRVILRGDRAANLGLTVRVMDAARKAGATALNIVTERP